MINKDTQVCMSLAARPSNIGTRFHNYLYQKLGLDYIYKAFTTQDIEHAIKGIRALGIRGCAISMPFKESCIPFVDELSESAQAIESVNTIVNTNGYLKAYNTDFIAIEQLIASNKLNPQASVIVRGSGGMAKAVVAAFKQAGFTQLKVWARNQQAGEYLASLYGYQWTQQAEPADILVNVTPIGMAGGAGTEAEQLSFPMPIIEQAQTIFDVIAMPAETPLIKAAKDLGKPWISGAEVATIQALEQFVLYTGVRPELDLVQEAALFSRQA